MDLQGSTATWREVRQNVFTGSYRTVAVDLTGHGKTTVPEDPERYSMEEQIEDLETFLSMLALRVDLSLSVIQWEDVLHLRIRFTIRSGYQR